MAITPAMSVSIGLIGRRPAPPPPPPPPPPPAVAIELFSVVLVGLATLLLLTVLARLHRHSRRPPPPSKSAPALSKLHDAPPVATTPARSIAHDALSTTSALSLAPPDVEDCDQPLGAAARPALARPPLPLGTPAPLYAAPIRQLHIELTSKCNAACPQCLRNVRGGRDNPRLPLTELTLADVQRVVDPLLPHLRRVMLCGNYGDPSSGRDCVRVVEYLRRAKPSLVVGVFTNGGAKGHTFWTDLGRLLVAPSYCRFAIDGLEDTNHLYRQKVVWGRLEANVRAFVAAGGHAQQDFLVFRHNEHQVEAARAWAANIGIARFTAKRTKRFLDKASGRLLTHTPVEDAHGAVIRTLEPPHNPEYRNDADMHDLHGVVGRHGSLERYYDVACISCKAQRDAEAYVSAESYVFPCCFLAGEIYNRRSASQLLQLLADHGQSLESLRVSAHRSVLQVLEAPLFSRLTRASWAKPSIAQGKLRTCAAVCGTEHRSYEKQWRVEGS